VRHFSQHSCNITINSHNGQLYASHRFTCRREGRYWVPNQNYCTVYSEMAVSLKPFRMGHMNIYAFFLLKMADTVTYQNIDLPSEDTLCTHVMAPRIVMEKIHSEALNFCALLVLIFPVRIAVA
jgi:hypothetical protein